MRIAFKKVGKLTKCIFLIVLVYALVTVGFLQQNIAQKQAQKQALSQQLSTLQQENLKISERIDALDTEEGIRAVAREKLGLLSKDEVVFYDIGK